MAIDHRNVGTHNQNTYCAPTARPTSRITGVAPSGMAYLHLPTNRGIIDPRTKDVTYIYAPPVVAGSSNPRTYGKRTKFNWRISTHQFF